METAFENFLKESLDRSLNNSARLGLLGGKVPPHLQESIRYSLLSGGKRIRPRLLLSCAEMLGLKIEQALPAAAAIEIIHTFTLIHDDLPCMDNDDFRRGIPTNHKKFGEGIALLAGDALMALSFELLLESPVDPAHLMKALKRLSWATGPRGVIGGQAAESLMNADSTLEELHSMHAQKTGALFTASLLIPKDLAGISDETEAGKSILFFAHELGLAFQVADDLEDLAQAEQKRFEPKPTSILFYISAEVASQKTSSRVLASQKKLESVWREKASSLCKISNEVIQKINYATKHTQK